jgi:hypothetical protein
LRIGNNGNFVYGIAQTSTKSFNDDFTNQHIYITHDEEIKDGYWIKWGEAIYKANKKYTPPFKKIILTTDQDLIKDGVQAIDDTFLEWFVGNPSCEKVEVANDLKYFNVDELRERHLKGLPRLYSESIGYKIIIPKEEPKQETLEEVAEKVYPINMMYGGDNNAITRSIFIEGAKWQQERSYSEEDMLKSFMAGIKCESDNGKNFEEFIKQFKKK